MADEDLSLKVDLEIGGVIRDLNRVVDGLADAQSETVKYDKDINRLETSATNLSAKVKTLNRDIANGAASARSFRSVQVEADKLAASLEKQVRAGGSSSTTLNEVANVLSSVETRLQGAASAYGELTRAQNENVKASQASAKGFAQAERSQMRQAGVGSSMLYDPNKPRGAASTVPASGLTVGGDFFAGAQRAARSFNAEVDQTRLKSSQMFKVFRDGQKGTADGYQQQIELQRQAIEQQQEMAKLAERQRGIASNKAGQFFAGQRGQGVDKNLRQDIFNRNAVARDEAAALQKTAAEAKRTEQAYAGLANQRYAMYDVARSLTVVSAATLGVSIAAIKTAADFESMFVQVQRTSQTSGAMWDDLRQSLMQLNSELPATVEEITSIATLGGQMGIAAENIDNFTESVVKFTASTNVTAEAGAEKLARVAQLAGVAGNEYDDLVASIYQASVTSVSTADDILSLTQQIAVSANQAGFAAEQTVALASALASLGVAPERARGSIQRSFNIITNSVDNATEELQTLARVSGMSAEEFSRAWKDDAQGALMEFLKGLGRAGEAGQNMNNILSEVGINAVRDSDALRRLAQNTEVYTRAIHEANEGWNDGTVFQEGYEMTAETLNNQLLRLGQTLRTIVDALQNNGPLKWFVGILQDMASALLAVAQNRVAQVISGIVIVVSGLIGVLALMGAGLAAGAASMMAITYALKNFSGAIGSSLGPVNLFRHAILQLAIQVRGANVEQINGIAATNSYSAALRATGISANIASVGVKTLRTALVTTGIGAALVGIGYGINYLVERQEKLQNATKLTQDELESLTAAVEADAEAWGELGGVNDGSFTELSAEVEVSTNEIQNNTQAVNQALDSNIELADSVTGVTEEIEEQTIMLGENTQEWINNFVAKEFHERFKDDPTGEAEAIEAVTRALQKQGLEYETLSQLAKEGDIEGLKRFRDAMNDALGNVLTADGVEAGYGHVEDLEEVIRLVDDLIVGAQKVDAYAQATQNAADRTELFGLASEEAGDEVDEFADSVDGLLDSIFAFVDARGAFVSAMDDLGASLHENGNDFSEYSEGGQANLDALKKAFATAIADSDGDAQALGVAVESIIAGMENVGINGVRNLQVVRDMVAAVAADIAAAAAAAGVAMHSARRDDLRASRDKTASNPNLSGYARSYALQETDKAIAREERAIEGVKRTALEAANALKANANLSNQVKMGYQGAKVAADDAAKAAERNGRAAKGAGDRAKKAAKEVQKEIRTVSDYVSDLSKVMGDAFNFRFGLEMAQDSKNNALRGMKDSFKDAREEVERLKLALRDYRTEIRGIKADMGTLKAERTILNYQLGVAVDYGMTEREAAIRSEIAQNTAEISEKENELSDANKGVTDTTRRLGEAQQAATPNLKGNTQASRDQRAAVLDLIGAYQDQIVEFANTGASQEEVKEKSEELRAEFEKQLLQLGYNKEEVKKYSESFGDVEEIIKKLPRNVSTEFDVKMSAADRALMEHFEKLKNKSVTANQTINEKRNVTTTNTHRTKNEDKTTGRDKALLALAAQILGIQGQLARGGVNSTGRSALESQLVNLTRRYKNYWDGGFVGAGGKKEPMGIVHGGEFVFTKEATRAIGPANLQAQMEAAQRGSFAMPGMMVQSGPSASMPGAIALTAGTIQQIAAAVQNTFYLNGQQIAGAANQGNKFSSSIGAA